MIDTNDRLSWEIQKAVVWIMSPESWFEEAVCIVLLTFHKNSNLPDRSIPLFVDAFKPCLYISSYQLGRYC